MPLRRLADHDIPIALVHGWLFAQPRAPVRINPLHWPRTTAYANRNSAEKRAPGKPIRLDSKVNRGIRPPIKKTQTLGFAFAAPFFTVCRNIKLAAICFFANDYTIQSGPFFGQKKLEPESIAEDPNLT